MNFSHITPPLLSFLEENHLGFEYYEHEAIFTVAQGEELKQSLPGVQTKNLFLTDKRGSYYLVCIESSKRLQINQFRKLLGAKDMTFGSPEDMQEFLGLTPGSVSIFGLIQKPQNLTLYLDQDIWNAAQVGRHPNRNDATLIITHEMLVKFLEIIDYKAHILEIGQEGEIRIDLI